MRVLVLEGECINFIDKVLQKPVQIAYQAKSN